MFSEMRTVYCVVTSGLATGLEEAVSLRNAEGDHRYLSPPLAFRVTGVPKQVELLVDALNDGFCRMSTCTESLVMQLF